MDLVSYILTFLVICVLFASGSPSISSKITVQGAIIRNGEKVIRGVEGNDLNIVCNTVSGIPTIKSFMNINGLQFKIVGNDSLTYHFKPSKKDNRKSFLCSAYSPLLEKPLSSGVLLDIQYAPIVKIRKKVTRKKLKLICIPRGNPQSYTFDDWEHWSEFKQHIRNVKGTTDGKLTFLKDNNNNSFHENDGIYKCKTSNGINGTNGRLYQTGSFLLNNTAPPIFVSANQPIQYGRYGEKINLNVHVYTTNGTIQTNISKRSKILKLHGRQKRILTHDMFHGVYVTVSGIKITFQLKLANIEDFTDYTIKACNNKGCNVFTVKVTSHCRPEPPSYVSVIPYARYIEVVWNPGFDGGYKQTCFVEYKQDGESIWRRSGPIIDNRQVKMITFIHELDPKTRYHVRVMSNNDIGESNTTAVTSVMTLAERPEVPTNVSIIPYERHLAVSWCPEYNGGDSQTFFIEYQQEADLMWTRSGPIIDNMQVMMSNLLNNMTPNTRYLVQIFSRNKIGESNKTAVTSAMTLEPTINMHRVKAVLVVVLIVIAAVLSKDVFVVAVLVLSVTLAVYGLITFFCLRKDKDASDKCNPVEEEVRENFQVEPVDNQLYISSDDLTLARVHNLHNQSVLDTSLPSTSRDNQTYQMQVLNDGGANGRRSCTYINRGMGSSVHNSQINDPSLHYSEITFNTAPTIQDAVIHGSVNRTIYSEIDLMAEPVAPLSSSESEYDEIDDIDI